MSTRSTISLAGPIHIYKELNTHDLCFEYTVPIFTKDGMEMPKLNEKYGSTILKREWLEQLHDEVGQWLKETSK